MGNKELIEKSFERLLSEGKKILNDAGWDGSHYHKMPPDIDYLRYRTESLNLIRRSCGKESDHYQSLINISESTNTGLNSHYFAHCYGIVDAAFKDFSAGLLFDMRSLVSAEILGEFIDQAESLLEAKYYKPAASLAGAILEDALRKLCVKNNVAIPEKTKIDSLNAGLVRAGVYDMLIQKRITALADIRNNADHGHFEKFNDADVEDMVKWVRRFLADYLG